jgi:hypothetical protein
MSIWAKRLVITVIKAALLSGSKNEDINTSISSKELIPII